MSTETSEFMPQGSTPSTSAFTCVTCGSRFITAELQRQHMKTDWHRYNLKRRVADLPSISSDVFAHKILQQQKLAHLKEEVDEFGFPILPRGKLAGKKKTVASRRGRALQESGSAVRDASPATSINSEFSQFSLGDGISVHEDSESNVETGSELGFSDHDIEPEDDFELTTEDEEFVTESETEDEEELVEVMPITYCFYCGKNNYEIEDNIKHMSNDHGLYIPERSFLQDLEGLLTFVNEVITIDNECLSCGFIGKNLESIRQHMQSKGHCKIPYESNLEKEMISEFYEFGEEGDSNRSKVFVTDRDDNALVHLSNRRQNYINGSSSRPTDHIRTVLPSGLQVSNRANIRYIHPPASLIRRGSDAKKSMVVADRRYAPGLTSRAVTKQERQTRIVETKMRNLDLRRAKYKRVNYQEHFRDEMLG